jgi:serine/threonine-protein kinase RsbW
MAQAKEDVTAPPREWRLRTTSDPAHLAQVRRELESFCQSCGFDERSRGEIVLCVNEALTNVTRHAYRGAIDRPVELNAAFRDGLLAIQLRDWGTGKKPDDCPPKHDPLCPGGVGLVCLRQLMDTIVFTPQPDGMMLTMERRLKR